MHEHTEGGRIDTHGTAATPRRSNLAPRKSVLRTVADAIDVKTPDAARSVERRIVPIGEIKGARKLVAQRGPVPRATDSVIQLLDEHTVYRYFDDGSLRIDGGRAYRGHAAKVARKRRRYLKHHGWGTMRPEVSR